MIYKSGHVIMSAICFDEFYNKVNEMINIMQMAGLEVEIQYQQSDATISVFVLGRK